MPEALPLVSAVLLSCDSEKFVKEAIRSALDQDYGPLELIVSDDASDDLTFEILQKEIETYCGPHRIRLRRRTTNSGSKSAHLNDVFPLISGDFVVLFDDDDVSEASRVRKIIEVFLQDPNVHAVHSAYSLINQAGRHIGSGKVFQPSSSLNARTWFARVDSHVCGATLAVRRTVIDSFNSLDPKILEDIVLPFRASLLGEVRFIDEELIRYRRRIGSVTQRLEKFDSMESYRRHALSGIQKARRHLSSRFSDLDTAAILMPDRADELEQVRAIAIESMSDADTSAGLVSPSLGTRVRSLLVLVRRGAYRQSMGINVFITFMPGLYLQYKRLWYKRRVSGDPWTHL